MSCRAFGEDIVEDFVQINGRINTVEREGKSQ